MEMKNRDMEKEASCKAGERVRLKDEVKDLKNFVEELKADIFKKETRLDHLQKQNYEFVSSLSKATDKTIKEFKTSSEFTKLLDKKYAAGFEDFHLDATKTFLEWTLIPSSFPLQLKVPLSTVTSFVFKDRSFIHLPFQFYYS